MKKQRIFGLHTLAKNGSLVFCNVCERIIASINKTSYKYINLSITCSCGNHCGLEFPANAGNSDREKVCRMPYMKNGLAVCKSCGGKIFGVVQHRVTTYSFSVECTCGEKYGTTPTFDQRLGETIKRFESSS